MYILGKDYLKFVKQMVHSLYFAKQNKKRKLSNKKLMTTKGLMNIDLLCKNKQSLHETFIMKKLAYFK